MSKATLATIWLDGCSGCHMSLLDMDERLIELSPLFELVYSPLVDAKVLPRNVDVALVEGSVSSDEDEHKIRLVRSRARILVSLGDCAVTGNVPAMRNSFPVDAVLHRAFIENATLQQQHEVVTVDVFVPGCPPSADTIYAVLKELLAGRVPDIAALSRFGI
jgi:NAD-reducing hydrogenase small subunit